jgi:hypothetical protein
LGGNFRGDFPPEEEFGAKMAVKLGQKKRFGAKMAAIFLQKVLFAPTT